MIVLTSIIAIIILFIHGGRPHVGCQKINWITRKNDRSNSTITQWAKAVIFTEKQVVASKGFKPKYEELTAFFKTYESRDETIGKGTL